MGTVFIAIDKCTKENGCLKVHSYRDSRCARCGDDNSFFQVLKGSHKLGRIEHKKVGEQIGADMERVEQVMKVAIHPTTLSL